MDHLEDALTHYKPEQFGIRCLLAHWKPVSQSDPHQGTVMPTKNMDSTSQAQSEEEKPSAVFHRLQTRATPWFLMVLLLSS